MAKRNGEDEEGRQKRQRLHFPAPQPRPRPEQSSSPPLEVAVSLTVAPCDLTLLPAIDFVTQLIGFRSHLEAGKVFGVAASEEWSLISIDPSSASRRLVHLTIASLSARMAKNAALARDLLVQARMSAMAVVDEPDMLGTIGLVIASICKWSVDVTKAQHYARIANSSLLLHNSASPAEQIFIQNITSAISVPTADVKMIEFALNNLRRAHDKAVATDVSRLPASLQASAAEHLKRAQINSAVSLACGYITLALANPSAVHADGRFLWQVALGYSQLADNVIRSSPHLGGATRLLLAFVIYVQAVVQLKFLNRVDLSIDAWAECVDILEAGGSQVLALPSLAPVAVETCAAMVGFGRLSEAKRALAIVKEFTHVVMSEEFRNRVDDIEAKVMQGLLAEVASESPLREETAV